MGGDPGEDWREELLEGLGRPVLVVFWAFVLWGTLYGAALVVAIATEGLQAALQRVLSGRDIPGGLMNLASAVIAALVWAVAFVAFVRSCRKSARRARSDAASRDAALYPRDRNGG